MKDQFGVLEDRIVYLKLIDKNDLPEPNRNGWVPSINFDIFSSPIKAKQ